MSLPSPVLTAGAAAAAALTAGLVLGGTGVAAAELDLSEPSAKKIKGSKIKPDSVTGKQVNESTLGAVPKAMDAATLGGLDRTKFQSSQVRVVVATSEVMDGTGAGTSASMRIDCQPGERLVGGGGGLTTTANENPSTVAGSQVSYNGPALDTAGTVTSWLLVGRNTTGFNRVLRGYALCAPLSL